MINFFLGYQSLAHPAASILRIKAGRALLDIHFRRVHKLLSNYQRLLDKRNVSTKKKLPEGARFNEWNAVAAILALFEISISNSLKSRAFFREFAKYATTVVKVALEISERNRRED